MQDSMNKESKMEDALPHTVDKDQRYYFMPDKGAPGYFHVVDYMAKGVTVTLPKSMTIILATMYENLISNMSMVVANEFMYGVVMGCTLSLVYRDELPTIEKLRDKDAKLTTIKYTLPSGVVIEREVKDVIAGTPMMEMLGRMGVSDKLELVADAVGMNVAPGPET